MRNFEEGRGGGEQETGRIGRIGRRGGWAGDKPYPKNAIAKTCKGG